MVIVTWSIKEDNQERTTVMDSNLPKTEDEKTGNNPTEFLQISLTKPVSISLSVDIIVIVLMFKVRKYNIIIMLLSRLAAVTAL